MPKGLDEDWGSLKKLPPIFSPILRCKHGDEYPDDKKHSILFDGDLR